MGDFLNLIENIQKDKERFSELVNKMDPLICKYMRILYKDEKEDVRSELVLALWEAVTKLKYAENEGQCVTYIVNALRNKFHELYRNSRKDHDNYFASEMTMLDTATFEEEEYGNLVVKSDLNKYLEEYTGLRHEIYKAILFENLSDHEIAKTYDVTRQYVHRLKKQLYLDLKEKYFKI